MSFVVNGIETDSFETAMKLAGKPSLVQRKRFAQQRIASRKQLAGTALEVPTGNPLAPTVVGPAWSPLVWLGIGAAGALFIAWLVLRSQSKARRNAPVHDTVE